MTFNRDGAEYVRNWWEERCIEWCFKRFEDGKFGDQNYLDDWPARFGDVVHVLHDKELALAPWNASRFPHGNSFFNHFHGLRLITKERIEIGNYFLPNPIRRDVYQAYHQDLRESLEQLKRVGVKLIPHAKSVNLIRRYYRKLQILTARTWPLLINSEQRF